VAKRLGRQWIGIERDAAYAAMARRRIAAVTAAETALVDTPSRREAPRVPFGALVERGYLKPGDVLFDASRRFSARVRADGTLVSRDARGSIHAVGAQVQGAPACNGWVFWHVEVKGTPVVIDVLRQKLREEMGIAPG
jgi:modification methylase